MQAPAAETAGQEKARRTTPFFVEGFRLLLVLAAAVGGLEAGHHLHQAGHGPLLGMLLFALVAYVVAGMLGRLLDRRLNEAVQGLWRTSPGEVFAASITGATALLVGAVICFPFLVLFRSPVLYPLEAAFALVLAVFGYRLGVAKGRQLIAAAGLARIFSPRTTPPTEYALLLDASAIMDRQLLVLGRSGLLVGGLVVPTFVVDHLRATADGPDAVAARRARRGLETLDALRETGVAVQTPTDEIPEESDQTKKLLTLGRRLGLRIATCNGTMVEQAARSHHPVIDLRTLVTAMTPDHAPGEHLVIDLVKEGQQARQAIGFLPGGDMVVVNDAAHLIGQKQQEVIVLSTRQTSQGLLVFAHPAGQPRPPAPPLSERPLYQGKPDRRAVPRD